MHLIIGDYTRDDDLIEAVRSEGRPAVRVRRAPETEIVLGRGSKPEIELNVEACLADGIPVRRRRGGGCSVVLDPGNVIVSVALPARGIGGNTEHFRNLSARLTAALESVGVRGVRIEGASDLALGERKVGGASIHRAKDLLHYSATLLIEPRVDLMERYLAHPPKEPPYRRGRAHRDFVGQIPLPPGIDGIDALVAALVRALDGLRLTAEDAKDRRG